MGAGINPHTTHPVFYHGSMATLWRNLVPAPTAPPIYVGDYTTLRLRLACRRLFARNLPCQVCPQRPDHWTH